jgi:hypothetical protein
MNFSAISGSAVWANTTRTLTGFGAALAAFSVINTAIAASATVSLAPAAGSVNVAMVGAKADASGTVQIFLGDGTNTWSIQTIAAGTTGGQDYSSSLSTIAVTVHNNSATVAAAYFASGYTLKI